MICNKLQLCVNEQFAGGKISGCVNHNFTKCVKTSDRRSKVKCEERKKKYVLENTEKNHIIVYKMDGGIIVSDKTVPDGVCKSDYLYFIDDVERNAILIELKGVDVSHALKQIYGTLRLYYDVLKSCTNVYGRIVVASSVPNIKASPDYVNLVRFIRKTFHGNIKIAERELLEKDFELNQG